MVRSSGLLRRHGSQSDPCVDQTPVPGTLRPSAPQPTQQTSHSGAVLVAASLSTTAPSMTNVSHPHIDTPILKHLPRGARPDASRVLQRLLREVVRDPNDVNLWRTLFNFAPSCFSRPGHGGKSRNLTSLVKRQIESFDLHGLGQVRPNNTSKSSRTRKVVDDEEAVAKRASMKLEDGDVKGAVRLLTSKDTLAPVNKVTLASLQALHPNAPPDRHTAPSTEAVSPLQATPKEVRAAIMSFPNGSAGGPDGLRPQHLKDLLVQSPATVGVTDPSGVGFALETDQVIDPLLEAITNLVNLLLGGGVPEFVRESLFGGSLTAISKKGGGIRPIAVGYTWRRLAGKVACRLVSARVAALLAPKQLGFGVTGGTEAAVHAARQYLLNLPPGHVFVKIDFTNAFNSLRRDAILEAVERYVPELLPYASCSYSVDSKLQFGEFEVLSKEGAQQGDPLGPLYFCLAIHELLQSLRASFVSGYLDDVSMGGDAATVADDFNRLETDAARLGLTLNRSKCEVAGLTQESRDILSARGVNLNETSLEDLILLGSPLMPGTAVDKTLASKRDELKTLAARLPLMPAHDSLFLLRNVVSTPRLLYTLRTAPCMGSNELELYDELLRSTLSSTLNVDLTNDGWRQASLPVRWGGLGVRSSVMLAPSAYLASAASTANLVTKLLPASMQNIPNRFIPAALAVWRTVTASTVPTPDESSSSRQRAWDDPCCEHVASSLLESASDDQTKARLRASQCATSGAWLQALPISSVGLRLADDVVRVAVGLRLGAHLCEPHTCRCGTHVDERGIHGLACKKSAGRHPRHGLLNDIIWRALQRAQVPSTKEPVGLFRADGKRPDGVSMIPWARGRCVAWDVTSPDTLAPSHVAGSAIQSGVAAGKAEANKTTKYAALANTHLFMPLAFETLGAWGEQAYGFVAELGRRITAITGDSRETAFLRQRLSLAIQRGNAIACRGTLSQ